MASKPKVEIRKISEFTPDPENANLGTERGLRALDDSIAKTGLGRSIVADKNGVIIGGNKTQERSIDRGFEDAIVVHTTGDKLVIVQRDDLDLTDESPENPARLMAYEDNFVASVDLKWDASRLEADLKRGIDLKAMFLPDELMDFLPSMSNGGGVVDPDRYSRKIESPVYEPSGEKPDTSECVDTSKTDQLTQEIQEAIGISEDERAFLTLAAQRHTVFNFAKTADLYAHGTPELQQLMENSALVIIDFNRAIELGFVKLSKTIAGIVEDENEE